jgi:uncharacterized membrane protein
MGLGSPMQVGSPNTYSVSEKGIIFEHLGNHHLLHFPIVNLEVKEESNCIEVEGPPTNTTMIPNKIRLFNRNVKKLQNLLKRYIET